MYYELAFLLNAQLDEAGQKTALEGLASTLTASGGTIVLETPIEHRALGYPVKKQRRAMFGVRVFTVSQPQKVDEITQKLNRATPVIRFMITSHRHMPDPNMMKAALAAAALSEARAERTRGAGAAAATSSAPASSIAKIETPVKKRRLSRPPATGTARKRTAATSIDKEIEDILGDKVKV